MRRVEHTRRDGLAHEGVVAPSPAPAPPRLVDLIGVYDASSSRRGEVAYWIRSRLTGAHCALCTVTHTVTGPIPEWTASLSRLPVPFVTYHRDDQPDDVRALGSELPVIVARFTSGVEILVNASEIKACAGSAHALIEVCLARLHSSASGGPLRRNGAR
jgi:hypothetical protein